MSLQRLVRFMHGCADGVVRLANERVFPKRTSHLERVDAGGLPPCPLIAGAMNGAVVGFGRAVPRIRRSPCGRARAAARTAGDGHRKACGRTGGTADG